MLSTHLTVARSAGIPVNIGLDYFHGLMDRLLLLGSVITKDIQYLYEPRAHYDNIRDIRGSKFFGLIATNLPHWKDEVDVNNLLCQYIKAGQNAGKALVYLDQQMTGFLLSGAVETKDDPVGNWLARELDRILLKKGPAIEPDHELSVFAMAYRGYRWLVNVRKNEPGVRKFLNVMWNLQRNPNRMNTETVDRLMYKVIGQSNREECFTSRPLGPKRMATRTADIANFRAIVEAAVEYVDSDTRKEVESVFAKIVRFARCKLPYGTPEQIFTLAKRMYYSEDINLFVEQQPVARGSEVLLIPYVTPAGAKQNPVHHSKAKGGKPLDMLRKVKKTTGIKRKDKIARSVAVTLT